VPKQRKRQPPSVAAEHHFRARHNASGPQESGPRHGASGGRVHWRDAGG